MGNLSAILLMVVVYFGAIWIIGRVCSSNHLEWDE